MKLGITERVWNIWSLNKYGKLQFISQIAIAVKLIMNLATSGQESMQR